MKIANVKLFLIYFFIVLSIFSVRSEPRVTIIQPKLNTKPIEVIHTQEQTDELVKDKKRLDSLYEKYKLLRNSFQANKTKKIALKNFSFFQAIVYLDSNNQRVLSKEFEKVNFLPRLAPNDHRFYWEAYIDSTYKDSTKSIAFVGFDSLKMHDRYKMRSFGSLIVAILGNPYWSEASIISFWQKKVDSLELVHLSDYCHWMKGQSLTIDTLFRIKNDYILGLRIIGGDEEFNCQYIVCKIDSQGHEKIIQHYYHSKNFGSNLFQWYTAKSYDDQVLKIFKQEFTIVECNKEHNLEISNYGICAKSIGERQEISLNVN